MSDFLRRLKLIDTLVTTLPLHKLEFVTRLSEITEKGGTGMFSDSFSVFSSSTCEFKGEVNQDGFRIKRRRRMFDTKMNFALASGSFQENNGQLTITTEIKGFNTIFLVFYIFLAIFYSIFIIGMLFAGGRFGLMGIPFVLLHALFMAGIPYFIMRRSVSRLKYDLEREFFYLTRASKME